MANIQVLSKVEVVPVAMHTDIRSNLEEKVGGPIDVDLTKPHAIRIGDDSKWLVSNDINEIVNPLRETIGSYAIFVPTNDGMVFTLFMEAAPADVFAKKERLVEIFSKLFGSKPGGSPLEALLGGLLGGLGKDVDIFSMRDDDMEDPTICKPYIDALTPESTIKFFPRNDRTGEHTTLLSYKQYRHLLDVGMIDHCPVCTKREQELVVHEEDEHTFKGIQTYLIAADAQINSVPAR